MGSRYRDILKIPRFVILLLLFVTTWDVSPLFERFVVFICICLPFTQSQCSHCSFVQANHLLNKIPQIISKAIFRTSLYRFDSGAQTERHPADVFVTTSPIIVQGNERLRRQVEREDGQLLILSPSTGSAAALSALSSNNSSAHKGTTSVPNNQISKKKRK